MELVGQETCPLTEDPALAALAALNAARAWATIVDRHWRLVYMSDDPRLSFGGLLELMPLPLGAFLAGQVDEVELAAQSAPG